MKALFNIMRGEPAPAESSSSSGLTNLQIFANKRQRSQAPSAKALPAPVEETPNVPRALPPPAEEKAVEDEAMAEKAVDSQKASPQAAAPVDPKAVMDAFSNRAREEKPKAKAKATSRIPFSSVPACFTLAPVLARSSSMATVRWAEI